MVANKKAAPGRYPPDSGPTIFLIPSEIKSISEPYNIFLLIELICQAVSDLCFNLHALDGHEAGSKPPRLPPLTHFLRILFHDD
jgi:hypothetical protein